MAIKQRMEQPCVGSVFRSRVHRFYMSGQGSVMDFKVGLEEPWILVYWRVYIDKTTTAAQVKAWLLSHRESDYSDGTSYATTTRHRVILWDTNQTEMGLTLAKDIIVRIPWDEMLCWSFERGDQVQFYASNLQVSFPWGIEVGVMPERHYWGV